MDLGRQLLRARQDRGLTQKQVCGEEITRNMLSQIEHGTALPSLPTLQYLARQLHTPVSVLLGEPDTVSPNGAAMAAARAALDRTDWQGVLTALSDFEEPDPVFGWEKQLLELYALLALAENALEAEKLPLALSLLEQAEPLPCPFPELAGKRQLLCLRAGIGTGPLPSLDGELLIRAEQALSRGDVRRCCCLLDAAENTEAPRWQLLRGQALHRCGNWQEAVPFLRQAEPAFPSLAVPLLEQCFRELGDYRSAYFYACKQKAD